MKKIIFLFLLIINLECFAESPFGPSQLTFDHSLFFVELVGGVNAPSMKYTDPVFDSYKSDLFLAKNVGLAFRIQFSKFLSVGSQVSYRSQGVNILVGHNYQLRANYLNVFVPVEYTFDLFGFHKKVCPMVLVFAGPYAAKSLDGSVIANNPEEKLTSADFGKYDFGAQVGAGVRIPTFSASGQSSLIFKISYYKGYSDTYPVNFPIYSAEVMEQRFLSKTTERTNNGFIATLSLEFELAKKTNSTFVGGGDGKKTFKRFVNIR